MRCNFVVSACSGKRFIAESVGVIDERGHRVVSWLWLLKLISAHDTDAAVHCEPPSCSRRNSMIGRSTPARRKRRKIEFETSRSPAVVLFPVFPAKKLAGGGQNVPKMTYYMSSYGTLNLSSQFIRSDAATARDGSSWVASASGGVNWRNNSISPAVVHRRRSGPDTRRTRRRRRATARGPKDGPHGHRRPHALPLGGGAAKCVSSSPSD